VCHQRLPKIIPQQLLNPTTDATKRCMQHKAAGVARLAMVRSGLPLRITGL